MNKAYQFRIYPNKEQSNLINRTFGCVRFVYNKMLGDKIKHYKDTKRWVGVCHDTLDMNTTKISKSLNIALIVYANIRPAFPPYNEAPVVALRYAE